MLKKVGYVGIIGKPNVGKSSLINKLVGFDVAIATPKPQTTRFNIKGIYTSATSQIIFVDTPGVHKVKSKLNKYMMQGVDITVETVDVVLLVVDAIKAKIDEASEKMLENIAKNNTKVILCINKIDEIKKEKLLDIINVYNEKMNSIGGKFLDTIPVSAKTGDGIDILIKVIENNLQDGEQIYDKDDVTDISTRDIASEVIRGVMLSYLNEEVPHGINIDILRMQEKLTSNCNMVYDIEADVVCKKASHKAIIIGHNGDMLKSIKEEAIKRLYKTLNCRCKLKLWVKVRNDWDNEEYYLKNIKDKIR